MSVAPACVVPKKQQIKLSPDRSGRRVRWTFEVSADVGTGKRPRAKKPATTRKGAKSPAKRTRRSSRPQLQADPVTHSTTTTSTPEPVAAPVLASQPAVASTPTGVAAPVMPATPPWHPTSRQMGILAGIAVLVIAAAIPRWPPASDTTRSPRQPNQLSATDTIERTPSPAAPAPRPATPPRPVVKTQALMEGATKTSVPNARQRTSESTRPTPPALSVPVKEPVPEAKASTPAPAAPMPVTPSTPGLSLTPVTITGCLEISTDGNEFRLADTEGRDAPKSRSWRTGFLGKRTAPVALVGASDPLALKKNVGTRVAATGLLTGRELQVSSLRVVAASCN